jgi:hypothetical protein
MIPAQPFLNAIAQNAHILRELAIFIYEEVQELSRDRTERREHKSQASATELGPRPEVQKDAEQGTAHPEINQIHRPPTASKVSADSLLAWLQSRPESLPRSTVDCPQCGASQMHLGNVGWYHCQKCGAELHASRCPICSQWYSYMRDRKFRLCEQCRAAAREFLQEHRSPTTFQSFTEADRRELIGKLEKLSSAFNVPSIKFETPNS